MIFGPWVSVASKSSPAKVSSLATLDASYSASLGPISP
eukprot:CAMPEP_0183342230 /NCGR_PEP_ID=MMETSP0164_2-20130417/8378_1 /TAXON_ID=221442 /ORGANISM="Coccolithus pelagicus ssp braarudi, Strain PLY182g" /LENGTH=37 /DNA_ID= /DNA_START= /DNA_END= /DNA_ORIENTATION=